LLSFNIFFFFFVSKFSDVSGGIITLNYFDRVGNNYLTFKKEREN
jgi:hypothetical protein